ncbi:prolipoprotein diacylglyceryl transferase [Bacillus paralicheniformis]|uniref:prolipoprotein diacylglyceryl transferase n=1 Tax=Bacillus paralicheniformis TaxID=1648923 RepID=UPI0011AB4126|nr:prolipoprotein diacylglyceryl transferase [Bacillus paralicheniformis]MCB6218693.1 prolipoprotein diacylglyceryl transferase [Bacillus paralicheniformis]MCJ8221098.1 prolipoprotein diacylglyceryl transferase [Bacillus paralicheniformis]MCU4670277.1 prolipoprotein diacylglyceryl transferase [Bacillus paralicheniformis]MEC1823059.1 prolipoprotein diacylglyceryl transferase [Bacillus paralicheniformis]TWK26842.1 Prolipoprotein diacylglyceryl transferase [Bacillus paralicheniformis]
MNETIEPLNPIAFHLGPIAVHWYGIIIGLGALLGLWLAVREGERRGLHKDTFVDLVLFAIPIAILCARAYYVIFQWGYYSEHPDQIIQIWNGGLAIHGGLIGAVLTGIIYAKVKGLSFWKLADIAAPSILLGQAIGRWGNFMNQEAHGEAVSRAFLENLHLPDFIINQMYIDGQYYQPTFLYESLWSFTGIVVLLLLRKANLKRGELFLIYVIWYSMGRYYIEGLRTDSLMLTANLRIAQVISIVLILSAAALIAYRRFKGREIKRYQEM